MPRFVPNPVVGGIDPADLFEELGQDIASRYAAVEASMMERIAKLAKKNLETPADLSERLRVVRQLRAEGAAIAAKLSDPSYLKAIMNVAAKEGTSAAVARLGMGSRIDTISGITGTSANAIANMTADLINDLDNMSERITRYMPDVYQKVISMTTPTILAGVETFQQSQRRAAETFLSQGVRGFTDAAGKEWRIGTYAEMATRTSVNRAWMEGNVGNMAANGINLVTIVVGASACQKCARHARKIYSTDGTPGGTYEVQSAIGEGTVTVHVAGTLADARKDGWNHPNCRCVVVAYLAGLPAAVGSTYDPQAEKDRSQLRYLERQVRDAKRREAASLDDVTAARNARAVKKAQARIRQHVNETGIQRRNYREQLGFSDGRGPTIPKPTPIPVVPPRPPVIGSHIPPRALPPGTTGASPIPVNSPPPVVAPSLNEQIAALAAKRSTIDPAKFKAARSVLDQATSAKQIEDALREAIGHRTTIKPFISTIDVRTAREVARAMLDMTEKFPNMFMDRFEFAEIRSKSTIARASGRFANRTPGQVGKSQITSSGIEFNLKSARKINREGFEAAVTNAEDLGHFHPGAATDPAYYSTVHEFGHILDYNGQMQLRAELSGIKRQFYAETGVRWDAEASGYGKGSEAELIAESFADVTINGAKARAFSRVVYDRLIQIFNEARPS